MPSSDVEGMDDVEGRCTATVPEGSRLLSTSAFDIGFHCDEQTVVESSQLNESKNQIVFQARQKSGDTGRRFLEDIDTVSDEY